jgi:hypothetical protein
VVKKIGFIIIGTVFIGIYIALAMKMFYGVNKVIYIQNELMFGSVSLLGSFISMTLILMIVCNYLITKFFNKKRSSYRGMK